MILEIGLWKLDIDVEGTRDYYQDFIITDKNFTWTFAHTHEFYCGPYFAKVRS